MNFNIQREQLLQNMDAAHAAYYKAEVFGGPSLHFHKSALAASASGDFSRFSEQVYALLASWGMHRMGRGGSKMRDFAEFESCLEPMWPLVARLRAIQAADLSEQHWQDLKTLFCGIRCMASGTSLVGNSKVLAHALPNLVPPIDREYTLAFLFGNKKITNDIESEWSKLRAILQDFFYPLVQTATFQAKATTSMRDAEQFKWDPSSLKVADNLVIGFVKQSRSSPV